MSESEIAFRVRDRFGLRIGPEMSRYLLQKLSRSREALPVIGGDARTGIPRRLMLDPGLLLKDSDEL